LKYKPQSCTGITNVYPIGTQILAFDSFQWWNEPELRDNAKFYYIATIINYRYCKYGDLVVDYVRPDGYISSLFYSAIEPILRL